MAARLNKDSIMARMNVIAALLAAGTALTACGPSTPAQLAVHNPSVYSINQPVVQRTDYVMDLNAGGGGVPDSELLRLAAWFESMRVDYGDRIFVDQGHEMGTARDDVARVASVSCTASAVSSRSDDVMPWCT